MATALALVCVTLSSNLLSVYSLEIVAIRCLVIHAGANISKVVSSRVKLVAATSLLQRMKFVTSPPWKEGVLAPSEHTWAVALSPRHVSIGKSSQGFGSHWPKQSQQLFAKQSRASVGTCCAPRLQASPRHCGHRAGVNSVLSRSAPLLCFHTSGLCARTEVQILSASADAQFRRGVSARLALCSWIGSGPSCLSLRTLMNTVSRLSLFH